MTKYLSVQQIEEIIGVIKLPVGFSIMSQDSYNEELIAQKIKKLNNPPELVAAAVNMAVVGYGNKKYGQFRMGENIVNIQQVFRNHSILFQNEQGALLKDDDLTPQRLCRFYRGFIRKYIESSNQSSYLWRKYSTRDETMKGICFRGAEYLDDLTEKESLYLLQTIQNMDSKLGTHIQDRIIRVFEAKGKKIPITTTIVKTSKI